MGSILVGALLQSSALRPIGRGRPLEAALRGSAWTPATLFAAGEQGVWYDPSDFSTMFQDSAGTTPVTAVGQPVGFLGDKSRGLALGSELVTNGDFSSGTGWTLGAGWTISGGLLNGATGAFSEAFTGFTTTAGATYRVTLTVSRSAGSLLLYVSNGANVLINSSGTFSVLLVAGTSGNRLSIGGQTFTGTIDNISVRELAGNHATQPTAASRPILGRVPVGGRRNLATFTEDLTNAVWGKGNLTTPSADTVTLSAGTSIKTITQGGGTSSASATGRAVQFEAKEGTHRYIQLYFDGDSASFVTFDMRDGSTSNIGTGVTVSSTLVDDGYYRYTVIVPSASAVNTNFAATDIAAGRRGPTASTGSFNLRRIQVETGSTATAYQRVTTAFDVTQAGVADCYYLSFDGTDDFLLTGTITPGTDKAQVFAGVRKLSATTFGMPVDFGNLGTGALAVQAPGGVADNYEYISNGTIGSSVTASGYAAPITNVVSGISDIAGDSTVLRVNGTQVATSTTDQGTGNYLAYPLYIGRRGGVSRAFNGQLYSLIVRFGANLDAAIITQTETFTATKTGVTL